jgi:hypothetical protein
MQTFLCYLRHSRTMADLDDARLNKQCVETLQILRVLRGEQDGYSNHPAVRMWEGYEPALLVYGLCACYEWRVKRKHSTTIWGQLAEIAGDYWDPANLEGDISDYEPPPWMKDVWILRSHRSNLIRKAPHIYGPKYEGTPENMPYLWPAWDDDVDKGYRLVLSRADRERVETGERNLPDTLIEYTTKNGMDLWWTLQ